MQASEKAEGSRLDDYLARLPAGLGGFPAATTKGSLVRGALEGQPLAKVAAALPGPLAARVSELPMGSEWVPAAHLVAIVHAICDVRGFGPAEVGEWARAWSRDVFEGPSYRILMAAPSPASALRSAGLRWGAFHRGSELSMEGIADDGVRLALRFPPRLFDPPFLAVLAQSFVAALEMSRAPGAEVTVESSGDGFARFLARW